MKPIVIAYSERQDVCSSSLVNYFELRKTTGKLQTSYKVSIMRGHWLANSLAPKEKPQ